MYREKSVILLILMVFMIGVSFKSTPVFSRSEDSRIELILRGFKSNISAIKDVQTSVKVIYENKVTKKGEWLYKPGCERASLLKMSDSSQEILNVEYIYNIESVGMAINYGQKGIRDVRIGYVPYIKKEIRQLCSPSFLFLHLWPVGITPEEIMEREETQLVSTSEVIGGKECWLIYIPQFGTKKLEGGEEINYDNIGYKVWFCPEEGFMPKKIHVYMNGELVVILGPITLCKFGEDIWFPIKSEMTWFHESYPKGKSLGLVEYTNIKVNKGINDTVFSPIFESGTRIYDAIAGISYTVSEETNSGEKIDEKEEN